MAILETERLDDVSDPEEKSESNSYRTILRSSAIIGSSTAFNVFVGLFRLKVAAIFLGPAGIGLIGLYNNLMNMAAMLASLGFGTAGTRRIAATHSDDDGRPAEKVRKALFWGTLGLSVIGALVFLGVSPLIANDLLNRPDRQLEIAWLALGVASGVLITYQTAIFIGFRYIKEFAKVKVLSSVFGTAAGISAIWLFGDQGLVLYVLAVPVTTLVVGRILLRRIKHTADIPTSFYDLKQEWRMTAGLGIIFVLSGFVCMAGDLSVRTIMQRQLGLVGLGHFQAIWAISVANLGLILGAMGTDFYPRLSAVVDQPELARRMINEQTEVALLLCAPLLLFGLGFAPWLVKLLYSAEFLPAVDVLRLQFVADVLKIVSWPLGITLMALGAGKTYFCSDAIASAILVLVVYLATPTLGLYSVGLGSLMMYVCYAPLLFLILYHKIQFRWSRFVLQYTLITFLAASLVFGLAYESELIAAVLGLIMSLGLGMFALWKLTKMANLEGRVARLVPLSKRVLNIFQR